MQLRTSRPRAALLSVGVTEQPPSTELPLPWLPAPPFEPLAPPAPPPPLVPPPPTSPPPPVPPVPPPPPPPAPPPPLPPLPPEPTQEDSNRNEPMRVCQFMGPSEVRYSCVYQ